MKKLALAQELKENAYPGRGIVIGRSKDGKKWYRFHGVELLHDLSGHIPDRSPIAGERRGEGPLQRNAQLIKPDRNNGEEADSHKALDGIEGGLTDIAAAAGILHAGFKAGHHQPCAVECPCQIREEQHDALHPIHGEELRAHVSVVNKNNI